MHISETAMAYVGEEMHRESMDLAMGLYVGGNTIGGMSGRLLTGVISDIWGWRTAILVMGILGLSCGLILWRALPARDRGGSLLCVSFSFLFTAIPVFVSVSALAFPPHEKGLGSRSARRYRSNPRQPSGFTR
jgi:predicted MFS family arabinose efflux permease